MTIHKVKSWTHLFEALISGKKKHDFRIRTERNYQVGDTLILREFDYVNGVYTGRCQDAEITYVTDLNTPCALSSAMLNRDACVLSLELYDDVYHESDINDA